MNEWSVTTASQTDYQDFGRAQLEVYNAASFGWAYWTLKNDRKHWDFEWNIRNNYLQLGNSTTNRCRTVLHHSVCTLASTMCYVPRARFRQHNYYINRVAVTMIFTRCNCLKPNGAHNCSLEIQRVREWWSCNE